MSNDIITQDILLTIVLTEKISTANAAVVRSFLLFRALFLFSAAGRAERFSVFQHRCRRWYSETVIRRRRVLLPLPAALCRRTLVLFLSRRNYRLSCWWSIGYASVGFQSFRCCGCLPSNHIVAIGHGFLKKFWPGVISCVLCTAGSSLFKTMQPRVFR